MARRAASAALLLLPGACAQLCTESPVNWTAVREDLTTYATLSEPKHRSRRCFGLDAGVWSYCGIAAMHLLQMQGGVVAVSPPRTAEQAAAEWWTVPAAHRNRCPVGGVALNLFALIFLTREERHGMLFHIGPQLAGLGAHFPELAASPWPLFGLLARLGEAVSASGAARPVDACGAPRDDAALRALRSEARRRVGARRLVPDEVSRRVLQGVERAAPLAMRGGAALPTGCAFAAAAAWAAMAEVAAVHGDAADRDHCLRRAEGVLLAIETNYTHLDWLSTQWPVFKLLHRLQFSLLIDPSADRGPAADLVPLDPASGRPMRFGFNRGFVRYDALYIDIAADIVHTEFLRSMPAHFGMREALPHEAWGLGYVYTSNDYHDLLPTPDLFRLRASSQRLVYIPLGHDIIGEKDAQCKVYQEALGRWVVSPNLEEVIGGMPRCFELPEHKQELRDYADEALRSPETRVAFVRKPEGAWGGRGVEIRYGVEDLLDAPGAGGDCSFAPLEDVQCLGLHEALEAGAGASEEACRQACCEEERARGRVCDAWNWRAGDGCWVGTPRVCSDRNPLYLGGWRGGQRLRGKAAEPRAVVQRYILDPVLYQLEGVTPPIRIKTDIRVYGAAVSLDPLRLYVSRHGYFRTGYLERNYSTATEEDFLHRLMHVTHHIPKIEAGSYHCPTAPSWGDHRGSEFDAGSGGSLQKWLRIAEEQNGLDRRELWENIKTAVAIFILSVRGAVSCKGNPARHTCGAVGFHFFADLVVDTRGRAWLMEIHPTLAVKPHGLGDPEGGWVEVLTRETRQGSMGTLAMFHAAWADAPYRIWAERLVRRRLLVQPRWRADLFLLTRQRHWQRSMRPGWGGEGASVAELLSRALVEQHLACRLATENLLPAMWRKVTRYVRQRPGAGADGDPLGDGLRSFYRLFEAARLLLRGRAAPGDLRPARCVAVDFNVGQVWDQPWERSSRRFGPER